MDNPNSNIEPVRASVTTLSIQIITLLIFTDLAYVFINYFLMKTYFQQTILPFDSHKYIILILAGIHVAKSIFQVFTIVKVVIKWLGNSYFVTDTCVVKRDGIFNVVEKTYDLKDIRSVTVHQNIIGKLFHFGDIVIETSASGGYKDEIVLNGFDEPQEIEHKVRQFI